jgi:hypothetical protein
MKVMAGAVVALLSLACASSSEAKKFKVVHGKNGFMFDARGLNQSIRVYSPTDEDPEPDRDGIAHDMMVLDNMSMWETRLGNLPERIKIALIVSSDRNAYALIYKGQRYIAYHPSVVQADGWYWLLGHEVGHHVCGHTQGAMSGRNWDRELEADRFSGHMLQVLGVHEQKPALLADTLRWMNAKLPKEGTVSHPPLQMRVNAVSEGYKNGSPCLERPSN